MNSKSRLFLVHLPQIKRAFFDDYPESFGFWDPLCIGQLAIYRSLNELKEGLQFYIKKNKHIYYDLVAEIPSKEEYQISDEMYGYLFNNAEPLLEE